MGIDPRWVLPYFGAVHLRRLGRHTWFCTACGSTRPHRIFEKFEQGVWFGLPIDFRKYRSVLRRCESCHRDEVPWARVCTSGDRREAIEGLIAALYPGLPPRLGRTGDDARLPRHTRNTAAIRAVFEIAEPAVASRTAGVTFDWLSVLSLPIGIVGIVATLLEWLEKSNSPGVRDSALALAVLLGAGMIAAFATTGRRYYRGVVRKQLIRALRGLNVSGDDLAEVKQQLASDRYAIARFFNPRELAAAIERAQFEAR